MQTTLQTLTENPIFEKPVTFIKKKGINKHLLLALTLAFIYHGVLILSGTFRHTYDALIHIFFADHYYRYWFDPWEYRWYTGFTMTSYPPGSQQSIALLAHLFGGDLQSGFMVVQLSAILMITIGIYRFSCDWVSEEAAGYASLLVVFCSSITETVHVFGQLPTTVSLGFLLNALPYAAKWLDQGRGKDLFCALAFNAATTAAHHVTTLFGAIFFVSPVIGLVIIRKFRQPLPDEPLQHPNRMNLRNTRALITRRIRRILPVSGRATIYGIGLVSVLIFVVLPYWIYSQTDPIVQVAIPHASRENFLVDTNAGLVFWLIPYGLSVFTLPYVFYKGYSTKALPLALSITMLFILGTGGTTPLSKLILGHSFYVLTLDRFTFWATICQLPLLGEFVISLRKGGLANYIRGQFGRHMWMTIQIAMLLTYLGISVFIANFTQFRQFQPASINFLPIVNFLAKDQHSNWRYITLGFGDQMSSLSAQTLATSVDGDYNAARQLPELNTSPIERLEGSKYSGMPGIGSLQQILAVPEKYNLKFIFSNDQFYDPLLYFSGWQRLQRLENGIMVWEREDIPPLPAILPRRDIPPYQAFMWGTVPMTSIITALLSISAKVWWPPLHKLLEFIDFWHLKSRTNSFLQRRRLLKLLAHKRRALALHVHNAVDDFLLRGSRLPAGEEDIQIEKRWQLHTELINRLKLLKPAPPSARVVRSLLLLGVVLTSIGIPIKQFIDQKNDPVSIVEDYYNNLDFRRYTLAYDSLDPITRPSFDQYMLQLSVVNGLVASYGKLNSTYIHVLQTTSNRVKLHVDTYWMTSLETYHTGTDMEMVKRTRSWYIIPSSSDISAPPDQFFRRGDVTWRQQGRSRVTTGPTSFADILDRPILQIISTRLVKENNQYNIVGELVNTDVNPADVTVTAVLYDKLGNELSSYNAQTIITHKLFPKEVTPFRIDFEGVAGTGLSDESGPLEFKPGEYTPVNLKAPIDSYNVYAKAVVTQYDLLRDVAFRDANVQQAADGSFHLTGDLYNSGSVEATVPHILVTYYNAKNEVIWVDEFYIENAVEPEHTEPIDVILTSATAVKTLLNNGNVYVNILNNKNNLQPTQLPWLERIPVPAGLGYTSMRVSVNYLVGVV